MSLTLYYHPLASYCQKVLMALYENGTPFTLRLVDLGDPDDRAAFLKISPLGKFPVLRDDSRSVTVPESSIIIEYLAQHYPGPQPLIPADADEAWRTRLSDRFFDCYVSEPMQKIVGDRLRPAGSKDPHGVDEAKNRLRTAYAMIEQDMTEGIWAIGDAFSMADCSAAPALFYANLVLPFNDSHPHAAAYFARLMERPSFARVVQEARPYFHLFPQEPAMAASAS